jgi:hypothetical protein
MLQVHKNKMVLTMHLNLLVISDFEKSAGPVRSRSHRYLKCYRTALANGHESASGEGEMFLSELERNCQEMKIYDDTMELNRKNSGDPLGGCQSHF